jgi:hypothetical protein
MERVKEFMQSSADVEFALLLSSDHGFAVR